MVLIVIIVACTFLMAYHNLSQTEGHIYFLPVDLQIDILSTNVTVIHITETDFTTHPVLKRIFVEKYDSPIPGVAIARFPLLVGSMPAVSPNEADAILEKYFTVMGNGEWRYVEYDGVYYQVIEGQP
ncbi:hypothetical protein [Methanorbis rubei]